MELMELENNVKQSEERVFQKLNPKAYERKRLSKE